MGPGTRLEVSDDGGGNWYVDLYVHGHWVAALDNRKGVECWRSRSKAKAQALRFRRALGNIPVVVVE